MTLQRRVTLDSMIVFLIGLILFTIGLKQQEIIGFEARFYLFALEMWRHGVSWFPTTYGAPYPDYPVTSTLLIYLTAYLSGTLNKLVAVFPSAVAAAATVAITFRIGALHTRRFGWYAVGFLFFTLAFITEARTISLDMYVTACTTLCFYFAYAAQVKQKRLPWMRIAFLLVFCFAIRGPIGLIIPTSVLCVFYLLEKKWRTFFAIALMGVLLLILCSVTLLWMAYHAGGASFMHDVLNMEVFGRLQEIRTPSHIFYFVENFGAYAITYPLAIVMLLGMLLTKNKIKLSQEKKLLFSLCGWILIVMTGLSIPADKKVRYILSIAPALALICAYFFTLVKKNDFYFFKTLFYRLCGLLPLLGITLLAVLHYHAVQLNYAAFIVFLVVFQFLMILSRNKHVVFSLAVFLFVLFNIFMVESFNLKINHTREFVIQVEKIRALQHANLVFYHEDPDGMPIKYVVNMPHEDHVFFVSDVKQITKMHALVITAQENFEALPNHVRNKMNIILHGKIGHEHVVVFSPVSFPRMRESMVTIQNDRLTAKESVNTSAVHPAGGF